MPVTVTPEDGTGLANANAFASVADVTTRLASYLYGAAWSATVDADKQARCVIEASAQLSRLDWSGQRTHETQALAFPRTDVTDPDGYTVPSNALPAWLLDAHARQALYLYTLAATPYTDVGLAPGTELRVGPIALTPDTVVGTLSPDVRSIIAPYLRASRGVRMVSRC